MSDATSLIAGVSQDVPSPARGVRQSEVAAARRILVFARFPEPGRAKTRLIPALGPEGAAEFQAALGRHTLNVVRQFQRDDALDVEVCYTGGDADSVREWLGEDCRVAPQRGADLGERLRTAVAQTFLQGVKELLIVGTDCPDLSPQVLSQAFAALHRADVVLGPALDGGYYLIGLRANRPELFHGIDWGTERVLSQTLAATRRARCRVRQLTPLSDVDYPEDLVVCRRTPNTFSQILPESQSGLLSIVIPTIQEAANLEQAISPLLRLPNVELIVADGGSTDGTVAMARRLGARVVSSRAGRGRQMNAGAALARGEALLFLHADTRLPESFEEHIWSVLARGAAAGAFRLSLAAERRSLRWVEWGANMRSHFLQLPYGDQGIFVRSELFYRLGGFKPWPLMEDYEFCRRLRASGKILLAPAAVSTSARRWQKLGVCRATLINQLCIAGFRLGVSPDRLSRWYSSSGRRIP